jgi:ATP-binding cassette subfamily B protein AbcA/BmrA
LFNIIAPVATFAPFFAQVTKAMGATERIQEMLDTPVESNTNADATLDVTGKTITADNLTFSYDGENSILHEVSFKAAPNTVIAFAGPSGGGKSTIFAMLERFYNPSAGQIKIGDQDISQIDIANWRSQIGFVSQDSAVFAGTIKDNLQYGLNHELTDDELWHGLELAYADQFVKDFPEQLAT